MKIAVVSDSHLDEDKPRLPKDLQEQLATYRTIIHAGDFVTLAAYKSFKTLVPELIAVRGNMDSPRLNSYLPNSKVFELEGLRIGLAHGGGAPFNMHQKVYNKYFSKENLSLIIFGHTHKKFFEQWNDITFLNPGSLQSRFGSEPSWAELTIEDDKIMVDFKEL